MEDKEELESPNQIGLHAVRNIIGHRNQLYLFDDQPEKISETYGVKLDSSIDRFGIDLTDVQMRVMEGILKGFTDTNYQGNISPEDKEDIATERYSGKLPETYKYLKEVPRLRVTQKQIIEWAGLNMESMGGKERALEALDHLGKKQYCFIYDRLAFGPNGEPERDRNGNWKKESVQAIDTLFTIKVVRDEININKNNAREDALFADTRKQGHIKYYEITPSPIFLDQRETYFMLVPFKWRDEVQALYGKKKRVKSYIFRFLYYLRYQYELKRRAKRFPSPFQIKIGHEDLAIALNMPKSVYKGKKDRAKAIFEEAYSVAKTLGYLIKYERSGSMDVLTLRDEKYLLSHAVAAEKAFNEIGNGSSSSSAIYLFDLFNKKKKELNDRHEAPVDQEKDHQLKEFMLLLKQRSPEEIEELIKWGLTQKYWCGRLSSPEKLRSHFDEAWTEMRATKKNAKKNVDSSDNRKIAEALERIILKQKKGLIFEVLSKRIEIGVQGQMQLDCIEYSSKQFSGELELVLRKHGIPRELYQQFLSH